MKIMPARIEEQITRVDPTRSRAIGIALGVTALWCAYRLAWLLYAATVLAGVGVTSASLVFSFILWGAIGVAATVGAIGFLSNARRT